MSGNELLTVLLWREMFGMCLGNKALLKTTTGSSILPPCWEVPGEPESITPFLCAALQDMVRRGEIIDDDMEDEFYLRRLDAGLFVLQLICYIMAEICNASVPQVKL